MAVVGGGGGWGVMRQSSTGHIQIARKQREEMPALGWFCGMLSSGRDTTVVLLNSKQL